MVTVNISAAFSSPLQQAGVMVVSRDLIHGHDLGDDWWRTRGDISVQ